MAECLILRRLAKLRQNVFIEGDVKIVRSVMRGFEASSADAFILIIDSTVGDLPGEDASDYELWRWARRQPRGVKFVPIDVKTHNITIGQKVDDRHPHLYHWSHNSHYRDRVKASEVVFALVEGIPDHVAVVPTQTWVDATDGSYGIETLSNKAALWMALFMVHVDHLDEAVARLVAVASGINKTFVNPTTHIALHDWRPKTMDEPNFDRSGDNPLWRSSMRSTLRLFDEIDNSNTGCRVELNPDAPVIHDFFIEIPHSGLVRCETKTFRSLEHMDDIFNMEPRANPWADRRMWHVLYLEIDDRCICITRDEISNCGRPNNQFLEEHTVSGFPEALEHIKKHLSLARKEVVQALQRLTPAESSRDIPRREIVLDVNGIDPLAGPSRAQLTLPWVRHQLNLQCMKYGYGVCLALGDGHPLGTHVMVHYRWRERDKFLFRRYGKLPLQLWSQDASRRRCVVLRLQQHSPMDVLTGPGGPSPFACLRGQWKKPVKERNKFLIIGSTLDHRMHREGSEHHADYLLLPSHFTALGSYNSWLDEPMPSHRGKGQHYFHGTRNSETELSNPKWPTKKNCITFNDNFIKDSSVEPHRYVLSLADGTLYHQILGVLRGDTNGETSIANAAFAGEQTRFRRGMYHTTVQEVLQTTWNYGYERPFRQWDEKSEPTARRNLLAELK
ncbi:hypothetical protein LTR37_014084 [Vermiconidia calcicola]|uniref:Uncharacterized protein n=1 Tax=Vermiconidia calcicola TaxID=1690605 RepID=A0ACC3MUL4_9PEZI|nr:hypothetical protein LTR37_014084 [Vermiconidia calcicola]